MSWVRIFWMTVDGLALITLVSGCAAPDGYDGVWTYYRRNTCVPSSVGK
jgi:hypothetical protein